MGNVKTRAMDPDRDLDGYLDVVHQMEPFPYTAEEWRERQRLAVPGEFRRHLVGERRTGSWRWGPCSTTR